MTAQTSPPKNRFDTNDAQYDLAWSETNENQLLVACGDGSIKMYDVGVGSEFPVANFHEHKREAFSVAWSPVTKDTFASSSWDGTVKIVRLCSIPSRLLLEGQRGGFSGYQLLLFPVCLPACLPACLLNYLLTCSLTDSRLLQTQWSPARKESLKTLPVGNCAYSTSYCPSNPHLISCVSTDSHLRVFDLRTPISAAYHLAVKIPVHHLPHPAPLPPPPPTTTPAEVLTHDWNKYREPIIATGGVDRAIRTFDIRNPAGGPVALLLGHEYAVRRLAWSPHAADILVSASYDMTVRLWTDGSTMQSQPQPQPQPPMEGAGGMGEPVRAGVQLGVMNRHTEFATGVDWCLFGAGGWVATVGWDERLLCWDANMMLQGR